MSISRITRARLYEDEALFNELLPYAKYDEEMKVFLHADASIWSIWELQPLLLTATSDSRAFEICKDIQELLDAINPHISVQVNWVNTFDIEGLLYDSWTTYPKSGPAGWMARRWIRMLRNDARHRNLHRRPRRMRLFMSFRFDPPWVKRGIIEDLKRTIKILFLGKFGDSSKDRKAEYSVYAGKFRGEIEGHIQKLRELGFRPRRVDGQDLIDVLYPLLNRRSIKSGKFKRGRTSSIPVPRYDADDLLANQISDTSAIHTAPGFLKKDGKVYRSVSMVKPPKQCFPLMLCPVQSTPYEHIISVTYSRDETQKQVKQLEALDTALGFRRISALGRLNQKIDTQISSVRAAKDELYRNAAQIVRVGVHQTLICQNEDEAVRASAEAVAGFPQLNGARGMIHEIADMGVMVNSLPGCYDPKLDGAGWTTTMQSSRAVRMFPFWGNWRGSSGSLFLLPQLWNRELVGFDLYDSNVAPNVLISGVSGAGKSYLLCYMLIALNRGHFSTQSDGQKAERQPITFVFDKGMVNQPCGFEKLAKLFGGRIYEASPSKAPAMNFLARLGETKPDNTDEDYKDLIDMCSDIILDMAADPTTKLNRLQRTEVISSLIEAHRLYRNGPMKREMILSDVVAVMRAPKRVDENEDSAKRRQEIAQLMSDYYGNGIYARFFDRPGALKLTERFIVFDLKALSRNPSLQTVFLKIAMLWADNVMNDPKELDCRKVLVFDEAHDLIGKTSANVIESAFRLYRKRKGIVIAASQSGEDFYVGAGGQAIVQNSAHKIFLRQDPSKFHFTQQAFNLNQQQADVITKLRTVKGVESQFYMISDIGEAALVLPLEPAFYWASTNNGDDNQLFANVQQEMGGDFWKAYERVVAIAPNGAQAFATENEARRRTEQAANESVEHGSSSSNIVSQTVGAVNGSHKN